MSLSIDGVWKAGIWAQTVWADGVWYEGPPIPPTPPAQQYSGGYDIPTGRRKSKAKLRREREEWGVLPKKAKALIIHVAAQQVEQPDNSPHLIAAFERAELAYKAQYAILYQREVDRRLAMMREEEEFLLLH